MNIPVNIPLSQLGGAANHLRERFGLGKVLGCTGLGCLLPVSCIGLFMLVGAWGIVPMGMFASQPVEARQPEWGENYGAYRADVAPAIVERPQAQRQPIANITNGQVVQVGPTPVYAPTNQQGGVYQSGVPSMMFNQPAFSSVPMQDYQPYQPYEGWENSTMSKSNYLARANFTGARRTPYTKGQVLTYGDGSQMKVVTGDFDFTLLEDAQGAQWACPMSVNTLSDLSRCTVWR
jgi:hypothetical protein